MKVRLISSRLRSFAIASAWIVAAVLHSLDLCLLMTKKWGYYMRERDKFSFSLYTSGRSLYRPNDLDNDSIYIPSVITVTLRRQDKVLSARK